MCIMRDPRRAARSEVAILADECERGTEVQLEVMGSDGASPGSGGWDQ